MVEQEELVRRVWIFSTSRVSWAKIEMDLSRGRMSLRSGGPVGRSNCNAAWRALAPAVEGAAAGAVGMGEEGSSG